MGILVNCPAYYSVSAPKAELLNKIKDMPEAVNEEEEQVDVNEKKVKEELGPVFCCPQKDSQGPGKATGHLEDRRGRRACHITIPAHTVIGLLTSWHLVIFHSFPVIFSFTDDKSEGYFLKVT